ncbi:hypothetical protein EIP91_009821 [Steccherinum ochraceum]|uniref:Uncharacterized protein n=1 Tax=Steccherinum ochraceum TaxID=92696 RepID=A0A4R0R3W0_9APHY|nr:hypothetical protein EIP91_009821 [Steccherinum ochraceum]
MSHVRRHPKNIIKRQGIDPDAIPTFSGVNGVTSIAAQPTGGGPVAVDPDAPTGAQANGAPAPFAPFTPTVTTATTTPSPTATDSSSESPSLAAASASKSELPIGTVVAACVGALVGAIILVSLFLWWLKRPTKARGRAAANARGRMEQRQDRGRSWNRLGDDQDSWDGHGAGVGANKVEMQERQVDSDEKNFPMFKKTMSMRTTRTAKALEEHGIDIPPFEFSQYHPNLAEELSLDHPAKPFATRQNSGTTNSWDGETIGDDSFLSLRSVRVDSGTMSPTVAAKFTPAAVSDHPYAHKWESAEVVHMEGDISHATSNPFADVNSERPNRISNPFFGAQEVHRDASRRGRSRSNSRSSRHSRNASRTSRTSRPASRVRPDSETNPFGDEPLPAGIPPFRPSHMQTDSVASGASGSAYATEQAMKNLIAALNLSPEEVEERLRIASMQGSEISRYSAISGLSTALRDNEDDAATITGLRPPVSPLSPSSPHAR